MKRQSMKLTMRLEFIALMMLLLLCVVGCASIKVLETWSSPGGAHRFQKIMIVGIGHDENRRAMAENILAEELGRGGVAAVASHKFVKEIDSARRDDIIAAVRSAGTDAVLTVRPVSKGDTTVSQGGETGGVFGTSMNAGGTALSSARSYSLATLQSNLYDASTAGLVWTATINTFDAERLARVCRDLGQFLREKLRQDGFL